MREDKPIAIDIFAGGGGWGDPLERDVNLIKMDVLNEKVSIKRARDVYGVVIDEKTMEVDLTETKKLRDIMRHKKAEKKAAS